MRLEKPLPALIRGSNGDDGDRNFDKGDLTHNRITAYGEFKIHGFESLIETRYGVGYRLRGTPRRC